MNMKYHMMLGLCSPQRPNEEFAKIKAPARLRRAKPYKLS